MGDVASDSTPLAMWMDGASGECGLVEEKDRMEEGGEAGYALRLRELGWSRPGPGFVTEVGDSSGRPCFTASLFSIAVRGDM